MRWASDRFPVFQHFNMRPGLKALVNLAPRLPDTCSLKRRLISVVIPQYKKFFLHSSTYI